MYLGCTGWVHPWYFIHFLAMYLQCTSLVHWPLPPVRPVLRRRRNLSRPEVAVGKVKTDEADKEKRKKNIPKRPSERTRPSLPHEVVVQGEARRSSQRDKRQAVRRPGREDPEDRGTRGRKERRDQKVRD